MEELLELKKKLEETRPVSWDDLPDIGLYKDQVVSYLARQLVSLEYAPITPAMVNNYIRDGLVPRPQGKRYLKEHMGWLTAVCALKSVLSVHEIQELLKAGQERQGDPEALYTYFCDALDNALNNAAAGIDVDADPEDLPAIALSLALESYAAQLACERILAILAPEAETRQKKKPN